MTGRDYTDTQALQLQISKLKTVPIADFNFLCFNITIIFLIGIILTCTTALPPFIFITISSQISKAIPKFSTQILAVGLDVKPSSHC